VTASSDGPVSDPPLDIVKMRSPRPRDAASIMLLDRSQADVRVLVGRRHKAHVFMPNLHVFPGGRRDRDDHRLPFCGDIHPAVLERLRHFVNSMKRQASQSVPQTAETLCYLSFPI
jgi:8-oxo-dGTP pyrophosphatase MutT (NUDIX family)